MVCPVTAYEKVTTELTVQKTSVGEIYKQIAHEATVRLPQMFFGSVIGFTIIFFETCF
jgi:hypothetical protein